MRTVCSSTECGYTRSSRGPHAISSVSLADSCSSRLLPAAPALAAFPRPPPVGSLHLEAAAPNRCADSWSARRALERTGRRSRRLRRLARHLVRFLATLCQSVAARDRHSSRPFSRRIRIRCLSLGERRLALRQHGIHHTRRDLRHPMRRVAGPLGIDIAITLNYGSNRVCNGGGEPERGRGVGRRTRRAAVIAFRSGRSAMRSTAPGSTTCMRSRTIRHVSERRA